MSPEHTKTIIRKYQEGYAINSVKLWMQDHQLITYTNEQIKKALIENGVPIRDKSHRGLIYDRRPGRFAHIK
jgi:hypothetical protein